MSAIISRLAAAALIAAASFSSAGAVGLGPLTNEGTTNSERKGFYLTLINPYPVQERFRLYSIEWESEKPAARVRIPISKTLLGPKAQRRILVIATGLVAGEEHRFRVCAERVEPPGEELVHARVCSKLIARRVA
jgi:P pilus assembly chaperone PapD